VPRPDPRALGSQRGNMVTLVEGIAYGLTRCDRITQGEGGAWTTSVRHSLEPHFDRCAKFSACGRRGCPTGALLGATSLPRGVWQA
jgi:hypothetical protein